MTTNVPGFEHFCYLENTPVEKSSTIWNQVLPLSRSRAVNSDSSPHPSLGVTIGDFFQAAETYLQKDGFSVLPSAVFKKTGLKADASDIQTIRICLKKHGEFYHPAKITIFGDRLTENFVLNVAVSDAGKKILHGEFQCLTRLYPLHPFPPIPRVFESGTVSTPKGSFAMFLGEWFEGYHEFHLSLESRKKRAGVSVWDETRGAYSLGERMTEDLYRQIAYILTCYYNPVTFEEIHPWHHASGDFVVKVEEGAVSVRLISVRDYRAMIQTLPGKRETAASVEKILQALLLFFLNLSCRIRLDRVSGTGEWIWAQEECVDPLVQGFFNALEEKGVLPGFPASLADCFKAFLVSLTLEDVSELLKALVNQRIPAKKEADFVLKRIDPHAGQLLAALQNPI